MMMRRAYFLYVGRTLVYCCGPVVIGREQSKWNRPSSGRLQTLVHAISIKSHPD